MMMIIINVWSADWLAGWMVCSDMAAGQDTQRLSPLFYVVFVEFNPFPTPHYIPSALSMADAHQLSIKRGTHIYMLFTLRWFYLSILLPVRPHYPAAKDAFDQ